MNKLSSKKVESTPAPLKAAAKYSQKDITPYIIAGFVTLFVSLCFFTVPASAFLGIFGIGISLICFFHAKSVSPNNTERQKEEKNTIEKIIEKRRGNMSAFLPAPTTAV